jgi:two-component system cell cycle response regulator
MGKPENEFETTARVPFQQLRPDVEIVDERKGATLTCLTQPRLGYVFRLNRGETVMGRAEDVDMQLKVSGISRRHALIREEDGTFTLEDLGSTNGTFCRGQKLTGPLPLKDRDTIRLGASVMLRFAFHDALEEKMGTELYERATRDPLTSARNRRYFTDRLDSEWPWARRHARCCSLLMLDLDHFKRVNDQWGHLAGDHVLREFVELVHRELRQEDLFGRLGGEEFAVLCRATSTVDANKLEKHEFMWNDERLPVTVSIGISTSSEEGIPTTEALLKRADERMYRAKSQGRNRVKAGLSDAPREEG